MLSHISSGSGTVPSGLCHGMNLPRPQGDTCSQGRQETPRLGRTGIAGIMETRAAGAWLPGLACVAELPQDSLPGSLDPDAALPAALRAVQHGILRAGCGPLPCKGHLVSSRLPPFPGREAAVLCPCAVGRGLVFQTQMRPWGSKSLAPLCFNFRPLSQVYFQASGKH